MGIKIKVHIEHLNKDVEMEVKPISSINDCKLGKIIVLVDHMGTFEGIENNEFKLKVLDTDEIIKFHINSFTTYFEEV